MRKYSGAAVQGLAILLGMDEESAEIIRDQHNRGHDMTEWINEGLRRKKHNRGHDMTEWINEGLRRKKNKERASRVRRYLSERPETTITVTSGTLESSLHGIANRTIDLGNNESLSRGVFQNSDGTWTALTFAESRDFKTKKGAERWLKRRTRR